MSLYNSSNTDNFMTVVYQNCTAILKIVVKLSYITPVGVEMGTDRIKNATALLQSATVGYFSKFLPIGCLEKIGSCAKNPNCINYKKLDETSTLRRVEIFIYVLAYINN